MCVLQRKMYTYANRMKERNLNNWQIIEIEDYNKFIS